MKKALIIFVRNPELGKVKTRLAKTMGDEKALEVYSALLEHTNHITRNLDCDTYVFYADKIEQNDLWENEKYHKEVQHPGDLGERMYHAFTHVFEKGYTSVQIIGSDCYELQTQTIETGFEKLNTYEIVIGPSRDGGYYLLGMKKPNKNLFTQIAWSTDAVFSTTMQIIKQNALTVYALPVLSDIDTEADWLLAQQNQSK